MKKLFVDTSYLIALEASDERNHRLAQDHWQQLLATPLPRLVTTTYVLDETATFFNSRGKHAKAVEVGELLLESRHVDLVHVDEELFMDGWRYFKARPDKGYSLTDCISFVTMERDGILKALSFDAHFAQAGFLKLPSS
jgi:predicted nucleic acid-binding protein